MLAGDRFLRCGGSAGKPGRNNAGNQKADRQYHGGWHRNGRDDRGRWRAPAPLRRLSAPAPWQWPVLEVRADAARSPLCSPTAAAAGPWASR
ncbi:hypothetical protein J113_11245 [Mycobacterium tuberculosis CAS/NITR204]|uniref:Uncharacterized protein n=1 Tax=Mycobacterium tuberculosis CAS/NITR204 TaxID=1310114 RepID=R4MI19_MYCTX|nr:hypothetical protein J113_11245 [Mycobacterium tuberculosis CAS/NITR204]